VQRRTLQHHLPCWDVADDYFPLVDQTEYTDDDEIDGDDIVQQFREYENQYPRNERYHGLCCNGDLHRIRSPFLALSESMFLTDSGY
jgi:hypothetical protein